MTKFDAKQMFGPHYTPKSKRENKVVVVLPNKKRLYRKVHYAEDVSKTPFVKIRRINIEVFKNDKNEWECLLPLGGQVWPDYIHQAGW